ncbi:putative phosphohydrolase [Bacillus sp. TS-2]|nr:putative phosphohydrolase [Bacillus sp. TS-2]
METEYLHYFDSNETYLGVKTREEIHQKGFWHETFHCWFISKENGKCYIHFQLRSQQKKDYPSLLDITAAGHIMENETISDGVREVQEELGIALTLDDLKYIGKIKDEMIQPNLIDREYGHVFIYFIPHQSLPVYQFQVEEVSGIFKVEINQFIQLWMEEIEMIMVEGEILNEHLEMVETLRSVQKQDFLPHSDDYIARVIEEMKKIL